MPFRWRTVTELASDDGTVQPLTRTVRPLDRACLRVIVIGLGAVLSSFCVTFWRSPGTAMAFLSLSLPTWLFLSGTLWRARALLGPRATRLGGATHLTVLRGLLVSLVAGFVWVPPVGAVRWFPAILYAAAAVGDRFDGIIARRLGQTTLLGAWLDEATDALGLLVAPAVAVSWGRLPPLYLLVGAAYYVFHAAIWLHRRLGLPVYLERVKPKRVTRIFAGLQMTLVSVALAPLLSLEITTAAATLLMIPTLILFGRDWLIAIGRLPPPRPATAAR